MSDSGGIFMSITTDIHFSFRIISGFNVILETRFVLNDSLLFGTLNSSPHIDGYFLPGKMKIRGLFVCAGRVRMHPLVK